MIEGQVQPFWLDTSDGEKLFCYHVLPLDVYLEHESELVQAVTTGEVVDELESTVGAKLLKKDAESRVVVNFHGVSILFFCVFVTSPSSFLLRSRARGVYGIVQSFLSSPSH